MDLLDSAFAGPKLVYTDRYQKQFGKTELEKNQIWRVVQAICIEPKTIFRISSKSKKVVDLKAQNVSPTPFQVPSSFAQVNGDLFDTGSEKKLKKLD